MKSISTENIFLFLRSLFVFTFVKLRITLINMRFLLLLVKLRRLINFKSSQKQKKTRIWKLKRPFDNIFVKMNKFIRVRFRSYLPFFDRFRYCFDVFFCSMHFYDCRLHFNFFIIFRFFPFINIFDFLHDVDIMLLQ